MNAWLSTSRPHQVCDATRLARHRNTNNVHRDAGPAAGHGQAVRKSIHDVPLATAVAVRERQPPRTNGASINPRQLGNPERLGAPRSASGRSLRPESVLTIPQRAVNGQHAGGLQTRAAEELNLLRAELADPDRRNQLTEQVLPRTSRLPCHAASGLPWRRPHFSSDIVTYLAD